LNQFFCIKSPFISPYLNLAAEEFLLKNFKEDIFFLYRNEPSVIIGKHQIAWAEINVPFVEEQNIWVIRRLSGGGAVYHDLGNLNFSWIVQGEKNKQVNFSKYISYLAGFLKSLGLDVQQTANNDLSIDGKKISGNAEHLFKNRLIHHGTLLYSTDLEQLNKAISGNAGSYHSKAVQSQRAEVINISNFLKNKVSVNAFHDALFHYVKNLHNENTVYLFSADDLAVIHQLAEEKYKTDAWNYGYSPKYDFKNKQIINNQTVSVLFHVEKGFISDFMINTELYSKQELVELSNKLNGQKHQTQKIRNVLSEIDKGALFGVFF